MISRLYKLYKINIYCPCCAPLSNSLPCSVKCPIYFNIYEIKQKQNFIVDCILISLHTREDFKQTWNEERMQNRKLAFYNSAKLTFEPERYIDSNIGYKDLKRLSQFRMSSHKYNIETGRYGKKQTNILNRICEYCTTEDNETIGLLYECPFFEPIVEDENHVLNICPRYSEAREKLNKRTCQLLQSADGLAEIFQDEILIKDMAKFTRRCHYIKFPEDEGKESAKAPKKKDTTPNKSNHLPRSSHLLVS